MPRWRCPGHRGTAAGLLGQLRVLNGFDVDLTADRTRLASRLRDALTSVSPALERGSRQRLA